MTDKGLTGRNTDHISHMTITCICYTVELVDYMMLTPEVNEKEQVPLGQCIRAIGMCFYEKRGPQERDNYQLLRNSDNPKDTLNCFEVQSQYITIATMNLNFSTDALRQNICHI